jgi:uncharacterized protein (TIGR03382 family)
MQYTPPEPRASIDAHLRRSLFAGGCATALLGMILAGCAQQQPTATAADPQGAAQREASIVGGTPTQAWPAVGALVLFNPDFGYYGSFCSATLITSEWVLTAGHCLTGEGGFADYITPTNVYFFTGSNATSSGPGQFPPSGELHASIAFYIHPGYGQNAQNDIALLRLAEPLQGVTPISIYDGPFGQAFIGNDVTYVGFGVNDGINQVGGGIKREGQMEIAWVESTVYVSEFQGQGVCFGDSGGPGLRQFDGQWRVIGVNSSVTSDDPNGDPCTQYAVQTRVDAYSDWLTGTIENPPELSGCLLDASACDCSDACQPDGSCDNSECPDPTSCLALYECITQCSSEACAAQCFGEASPESQAAFSAMASCLNEECGNAQSQQAYQQCAFDSCGAEIGQCFEPGGGGGTNCAETYACIADCNSQGCYQGCYQDATIVAQGQLNAMFGCLEDQCADQTSGEAFQQCAYAQCGEEVNACLNSQDPPQGCDLLGGDCPDELACTVTEDGGTACMPTEDTPAGDACDGPGAGKNECEDGSACVAAGPNAWLCAPLCETDADCDAGLVCAPPALPRADSLGACLCPDGDGDGVCAEADCNDDDAAVGPGRAEVCGNGVDDDCSGTADDGCAAGEDGGESAEDGSESADEGGDDGKGQGGEAGSGDGGNADGGGVVPSLEGGGEEGSSDELSEDTSDGGSGGCSASRSGSFSGAWLGLSLLALGLRRRKRTAPPIPVT